MKEFRVLDKARLTGCRLVMKDRNAVDFKHCCGFQAMINVQEYCGFQVFAIDLSNEHVVNLSSIITIATSILPELRIKQNSYMLLSVCKMSKPRVSIKHEQPTKAAKV